jgi:hypothetical protein
LGTIPEERFGNQLAVLPEINQVSMLRDIHFQDVPVNFFDGDLTVGDHRNFLEVFV